MFACPNNTVFQQRHLVCDWAFNVHCEEAERFFGVNSKVFQGHKIKLEESSRSREILQPHLQPHLQKIAQFMKETSKINFRNTTRESSNNEKPTQSLVTNNFATQLIKNSAHVTTESIINFVGESLPSIGEKSQTILEVTPWINHPSC